MKTLRALALASLLPVVVAGLGLPIFAGGQTTGRKNPDLVIKSVAGQDLSELLLRVVSRPRRQGPGTGDAGIDFRTRCRETSRERLELAVPAEARAWCTVETVLSEGKPYREIIDAAAEHHCDLIVMGVRGRNALDLALFGSTTQQVVRLATAPVLTIRESKA